MSCLTINARSGVRGSVTSSPFFSPARNECRMCIWSLSKLREYLLPTYVVQLSLCSALRIDCSTCKYGVQINIECTHTLPETVYVCLGTLKVIAFLDFG